MVLKENYQKSSKEFEQDYCSCLGKQSWNCIFLGEFVKAVRYAREGLEIDSTKTFIYANLVVSLLCQGKYKQAEQICSRHKEELKGSFFLSDFEAFEEANVIPQKYKKDVEKIKQMLNE